MTDNIDAHAAQSEHKLLPVQLILDLISIPIFLSDMFLQIESNLID